MATYYTTRDIKNQFNNSGVRVFCSTLNRLGKTRVTVAIGDDSARGYNDCEKILFQDDFLNWNAITAEAFAKIQSAVNQHLNY